MITRRYYTIRHKNAWITGLWACPGGDQRTEYRYSLLHWTGPTARCRADWHQRHLQHAPCDAAVRAKLPWKADGPGAALRGSPNLSDAAAKVANALAALDSTITLFHARQTTNGRAILSHGRLPRIRRISRPKFWPDGLVREAWDLRPSSSARPSRNRKWKAAVQRAARAPVGRHRSLPFVLVRSWRPEAQVCDSAPVAAARGRRLSTYVDRWFCRNTFHSHEFSDLQALMALKEKLGVAISIGLLRTQWEADTVGRVIETIKRPMMDEIPD